MKKLIFILLLTISLCIYSEICIAEFGGEGAFGSVINYLKRVATNIIPSADDTYDLGSSTKEWKDAYIDGTLYVDTISGVTIASDAFKTLSVSGQDNVVADSATDTLTLAGAGITTITTNATTDTITFTSTEVDGSITNELPIAGNLIDISGSPASTVDVDLTEAESVTWGAGAAATIVHTYNVSGTDTTMTMGSAATTFSGTVAGSNLSGSNTGDNTVATSGDSATSFFSSGTLEVAIGGTGTTTSTGTGSVMLGTSPTITTSLIMSDGATIGQAAGPLVAFDDTLNYLEITGCNVGIGTTVPGAILDVGTAGTSLGKIRLSGNTSGNVTLQPNAIAGTDIVLTLPATTGTLYVTGGTDVAFADGGTGLSSWTQYLIPYAATTTSIGQIAIGTSGQVLTSNGAGAAPTFQAAAGAGANTALSNLASVAINTSLLSDADNTDDLGDATHNWKDLYLSGNITDDVNTLTVANAKTAYDHSQDNTQAHTDYFKNTSDTFDGTATFNNVGNASIFAVTNAGTQYAMNFTQSATLAAGYASFFIQSSATAGQTGATGLVWLYDSDADTTKPMLNIQPTGTQTAHIQFDPLVSSSYAVEGGLYADTDGVLYYYSNSAWAACNSAADFGELMQQEGNKSQYEVGDVIVIGTENISQEDYKSRKEISSVEEDSEGNKHKVYKGWKIEKFDEKYHSGAKKVKKSTSPYDKKVIGVISDRAGYLLDDSIPINKKQVVVGLIGLVKVKVCDEGGNIQAGDILVSSSKTGYAMKGIIDSFNKIGSVIGKAREDITFTSKKTGIIEMVIGVK